LLSFIKGMSLRRRGNDDAVIDGGGVGLGLALGLGVAGFGFCVYKTLQTLQSLQQQLLEVNNTKTTMAARDSRRPSLDRRNTSDDLVGMDQGGSNSGRGNIKRVMEVQKIYKGMCAPGQRRVLACDLAEHLQSAAGETLSDDDLQEALELMGVADDGRQEVSFTTFYDWWTEWSATAVASSKRGHSEQYTRRFKLQHTLDVSSKKFDVDLVKRRFQGTMGKKDFRVNFYLAQEGQDELQMTQISPWHDIPLSAGTSSDGVARYHAVIEIPKWTREKFEISTGELYNPIKQDTKDGELRNLEFYQMFNYGALPQTWEDPGHVHPNTGYRGDNDPIDCVEIGSKQVKMGEVIVVRVLGVLGMIDDDETDWKLIVINEADPMAKKLKDVGDVRQEMPGLIEGVLNWFKQYKSKLGTKPENKFAFNSECQGREFAQTVLEECYESWLELQKGKAGIARSEIIVPTVE
jgi:inorganic pyrophosphatase